MKKVKKVDTHFWVTSKENAGSAPQAPSLASREAKIIGGHNSELEARLIKESYFQCRGPKLRAAKLN